jgi:DNA repair protein SbcD/Mre11
MPKFLHAADLHLDSPMKGLAKYDGMPLDVLRGATRRALENLVETALRERVDFVVVAGDLYDGDWKDYTTGIYFGQQMRKLADSKIPVFLIAGNHDAANAMTRSLPLPPGVVMLSHEEPQTKTLDDFGLAIHGQSFANKAVVENLACRYPDPMKGLFNIGVLHTCVGGAEGHERYAPCELSELVERGYQYWALGHIHKREVLHQEPYIVFPGNTQGRHARELGEKGCMIVRYDSAFRTQVEFRPLGVVDWIKHTVDVTDLHSPEAVLEAINDAVVGLHANTNRTCVVRLEVVGCTAAHEIIESDTERWASAVRSQAPKGFLLEKVKFRTQSASEPPCGDGGLDDLLSVVGEAAAGDGVRQKLTRELVEIRRKLMDAGAEKVEFDPEEAMWLDEIVGEARMVLLEKLGVGGRS